ncbi:hypothetical protein KIL84_001849 [Mauremys mutica]|uniref:Uncharacterized protein n=1 Tax=Mauremys mutica TaxID=74926 RepID=A0A9D4B5E3_9SAUR|nr:hypothetical protein KIL84_001849 [Mauremys mutica]
MLSPPAVVLHPYSLPVYPPVPQCYPGLVQGSQDAAAPADPMTQTYPAPYPPAPARLPPPFRPPGALQDYPPQTPAEHGLCLYPAGQPPPEHAAPPEPLVPALPPPPAGPPRGVGSGAGGSPGKSRFLSQASWNPSRFSGLVPLIRDPPRSSLLTPLPRRRTCLPQFLSAPPHHPHPPRLDTVPGLRRGRSRLNLSLRAERLRG